MIPRTPYMLIFLFNLRICFLGVCVEESTSKFLVAFEAQSFTSNHDNNKKRVMQFHKSPKHATTTAPPCVAAVSDALHPCTAGQKVSCLMGEL